MHWEEDKGDTGTVTVAVSSPLFDNSLLPEKFIVDDDSWLDGGEAATDGLMTGSGTDELDEGGATAAVDDDGRGGGDLSATTRESLLPLSDTGGLSLPEERTTGPPTLLE